jgi:hypothetical protein
MRTHAQCDPKYVSLRQHATLNPHPERVSDALFQTNLFFDPRDLLQVKYEMLRRVVIDGQPMGTTAAAFGFSRITLSQLRKRFEADGLAGLLLNPRASSITNCPTISDLYPANPQTSPNCARKPVVA